MSDNTPFKIGETSDQVLFVMNRTGRKFIKPPENVGTDKEGLVVKWCIGNEILTFKRSELHGITAYRITEIVKNVKSDISIATTTPIIPEVTASDKSNN